MYHYSILVDFRYIIAFVTTHKCFMRYSSHPVVKLMVLLSNPKTQLRFTANESNDQRKW